MVLWHDDDELFRLMKEKLYTPVVGDILDTMGFVHQFLPPELQPLRDTMKLAAGPALFWSMMYFPPRKSPSDFSLRRWTS